jgi:hypothetical protein
MSSEKTVIDVLIERMIEKNHFVGKYTKDIIMCDYHPSRYVEYLGHTNFRDKTNENGAFLRDKDCWLQIYDEVKCDKPYYETI